MIYGSTFLWLHLPKTGGTTMNHIMRGFAADRVVVDPDHLDSKHDSIKIREESSDWRAGSRQKFITMRHLKSWLISDWQHKRRHMNLMDLPFNPVRCGLFYSLRLGGTWVAADWWLQYFEVDSSFKFLRLEHLVKDFNLLLLPYLPQSIDPIRHSPRQNTKPAGLCINEPNFTEQDLDRIYQNNPRWAALEQHLY